MRFRPARAARSEGANPSPGFSDDSSRGAPAPGMEVKVKVETVNRTTCYIERSTDGHLAVEVEFDDTDDQTIGISQETHNIYIDNEQAKALREALQKAINR